MYFPINSQLVLELTLLVSALFAIIILIVPVLFMSHKSYMKMRNLITGLSVLAMVTVLVSSVLLHM